MQGSVVGPGGLDGFVSCGKAAAWVLVFFFFFFFFIADTVADAPRYV